MTSQKKKMQRSFLLAIVVGLIFVFLAGCAHDNPNASSTMGTESGEHSPGHYENGCDDDLDSILVEYFNLAHQQDTYFYFHVHPRGGGRPEMMSLAGLRAMYRELNEQFDYIVVHDHPFDYIGHFSGAERFVNNPPEPIPDVAFRNQRVTDRDGNQVYWTSLRGVQLGRMLYRYFGNNIALGRNFEAADFYVNSPDDVVNVILGAAYIGIYDVGDTLSLSLYAMTKAFNFRVIGFFEAGTSFPHMSAAFETIYFDYAIIMPYFAINYEPTDEHNRLFQIKLYLMKTSGNVRIMESIDVGTNIEVHAKYLARINEIANRHGVAFDMPLRADT
ncbi:MAG: hypothetical protein FWD84_05130 [Oscillospiraceae bacterium]|nr:hypothetical protein [Oscillospiraceae bacterium]